VRGGYGHSLGLLLLFLIFGAVAGGILGELVAGWPLGGVTPYLVKTFSIFDLPPITVNLYVVKFVFGLSLHPNLISILGVIGAYLLFRRL